MKLQIYSYALSKPPFLPLYAVKQPSSEIRCIKYCHALKLWLQSTHTSGLSAMYCTIVCLKRLLSFRISLIKSVEGQICTIPQLKALICANFWSKSLGPCSTFSLWHAHLEMRILLHNLGCILPIKLADQCDLAILNV